jgi:hypothetical protein
MSIRVTLAKFTKNRTGFSSWEVVCISSLENKKCRQEVERVNLCDKSYKVLEQLRNVVCVVCVCVCVCVCVGVCERASECASARAYVGLLVGLRVKTRVVFAGGNGRMLYEC